MIYKEMQERINAVKKRVAEGRISRIIPYQELTSGDPSKERMLGRLEAYLQTGVVIDHDDLIKVIDEYKFSPEEYAHLVPLAQTGIIEGLVQEPDNLEHYGMRMKCFSSLANKFFEEKKMGSGADTINYEHSRN